jgi:biotin carboxyl carrier protein
VRYFVSFGADDSPPAVVEVIEQADGALAVRVDGAPVPVDVASAGERFEVRVGARVLDLSIGATAGGHEAFVRGRHTPLLVENERARGLDAGRASAAARSQGAIVRSPMPGRVVRMLVAVGQTVEAGQGVAVLEAMKMENEVRTRDAGRVLEVHAAPGAAVEANAKLVTLGAT